MKRESSSLLSRSKVNFEVIFNIKTQLKIELEFLFLLCRAFSQNGKLGKAKFLKLQLTSIKNFIKKFVTIFGSYYSVTR